ncbi:MAG: Alpha N-terminal protein methyltransferase 1 [Peltula sp. TS41687]|nr:MAG: Alpha N-terminal protein methyltransferase 1 [Peltula sp. TS41687]
MTRVNPSPEDEPTDEKPHTISPDAQINHAAALAYWGSVQPDVNGMLGGYPQISRIDLQGSANFLAKLRRLYGPNRSLEATQGRTHYSRAVDCGAGIGRVTRGLLADVCDVVDLVEPVHRFAREVEHGTDMAHLRDQGKIGKVYTTPLETWEPAPGMYDLVWNQWCLGHLTDAQLVAYLSRCIKALKEGGWVVVKENMSTDVQKKDLFDPEDNSVTRTDEKFRQLFNDAGLELVQTELQTGIPRSLGLYPVRFYALRPVTPRETDARTPFN